MPAITVILCTYNPSEHFLRRTLDHLRAQTLPLSEWRLLVVDNNSTPPVAERLSFDGLPVTHVREPEPGLTPARLCGFREADTPYLVLVDDDNLLDCNYLQTALDCFQRHPKLGVASGTIEPDFLEASPRWLGSFHHYLAVRVDPPEQIFPPGAPVSLSPCGAGMILRREVAAEYRRQLREAPGRRRLDRSGASLASAGDTDLALCAHDIGLELASLPALRLRHIIPPARTRLDYMERLAEGMTESGAWLRYLRQGKLPSPPGTGLRDRLRPWLKPWLLARPHRRILQAEARGLRRARRDITRMLRE